MKLSVVIPAYNAEEYIVRCVESVLAQCDQWVEIIIINDCSTDNTSSILCRYSDTVGVKVINNKNNYGPLYSRQLGVNMSSGDYIMFLDADDWILPGAISLLMETMNKEACDLVIGNIKRVNKQNCVTSTPLNRSRFGYDRIGLLRSLLNGTITHSLCGRIFKRGLFDNLVFDKHITNGDDALVMYAIAEKITSFFLIESYVYAYYYNPRSSSNKRLSEKQIDNIVYVNFCQRKLMTLHPSLKKDIEQKTIQSILNMLYLGYDKTLIRRLMEKYYGTSWISFSSLIKYNKGMISFIKSLVYWYMR